MTRVREAVEGDLEAVFGIYDPEVLHGTATFETAVRSPAGRREWWEAHPRGRYPVVVAVEEGGKGEGPGSILGWGRLAPWSPRPAYARTAETSVYVAAGARGRGVGKALLADLVSRARAAGIAVLVARIAGDNPASVALHEGAGFRTFGVQRRAGEKFGRVIDVRMLDLHLDGGGEGG